MSADFVPLVACPSASPSTADFRVKIVPNSQQAAPFIAVRPPGARSSESPCAGAGAEPTMTLQRDGDRITSVRIQCACGQVIELACVY